MSNNLRIAYFGTPRFSVFVLEALVQAGHAPTLVVTTPDKPAGRGLVMKQSPVKEAALSCKIAVVQPETLNPRGDASRIREASPLELLVNSEWDLFVVAGYGKILPQDLIDLPKHGCLNVHPSLLPKFRGPSPIESQILQDENEVGVTVLVMDDKMDHGPILAQAKITLDRSSSETVGAGEWPLRTSELEDILWQEGGNLLVEAIPPYLEGTLKPTPQDESLATYTKFIKKEDGRIEIGSHSKVGDPSVEYKKYLKFCAYDGWPGTYFLKDGKRIKIVGAIYEDGQFKPLRIIPEGKKEQNFIEDGD